MKLLKRVRVVAAKQGVEVTQQEVLAFLYTPPSLASNERENPRFKSAVSSSQVWYLRFLPYLLC